MVHAVNKSIIENAMELYELFFLKMCWFVWSCLMCNLEQIKYYTNLKQMEVEQPSPYNSSSVLQHVDNPNDIMYCHNIDLIAHYSHTYATPIASNTLTM